MALTRELAITYNGFTVGAGTERRLHGMYSVTESYRTARITFQFVVEAASEAAFTSACTAVEDAYRVPWQNTTVLLGGNTLHSWSQDAGTGLNAEAVVTKPGSAEFDSARTRLYQVTITIGRPADVDSRNGRREINVAVSFSSDRIHTVSFSGTYTADGSDAATDTYEADAKTYAGTVLDGLDDKANFELVRENFRYQEKDRVLDFNLEYVETTDGVELTYAGVTVGGASGRRILGGVTVQQEFDRLVVEVKFRITAANAAAFTSEADTVETAFRTPRQDLELSVGGSTYLDLSQSSNTGLDATPTIRREGDPGKLGVLSRTYTATVTVKLPADVASLDGRREASILVEYDEDRRMTVTIYGIYTAVSGSTASEKYESSIEAFATSILGGFSSRNFELVDEQFEYFETDKEAKFRRVYTETTTGVAITYNSVTIGTGSTNRILGEVSVEQSFETATARCRFVIAAANPAALAAAAESLEADLRVPRQDLVITIDGTDYVSWGQSDNTGFDAAPRIRRTGDPSYAGFMSRTYEFEVTVGLPADVASLAGRREATVTIGYTPSRRRSVKIVGTYTAVSTDSATAKYNSEISAFVTATLPTTTGVWELTSENLEYFETDKVAEFSRTYLEQLAPKPTSGVLAATGFRDQTLSFNLQTEGWQGDDPRARNPTTGAGQSSVNELIYRMSTLEAAFSANIDLTTYTDSLGELYYNTIRPFIVQQALGLTYIEPGSEFALMTDTFQIDPVDGRVNATMSWRVIHTSKFINFKRTDEFSWEIGTTFRGVWDGNPLSAYEYQGLSVLMCTVTEEGTWAGPSGGGVFDGSPAPILQGLGSQGIVWRPVSRKRSMDPRQTGHGNETNSNQSFKVYDFMCSTVWRGIVRAQQQPQGNP